jgi:hypothetical protein
MDNTNVIHDMNNVSAERLYDMLVDMRAMVNSTEFMEQCARGFVSPSSVIDRLLAGLKLMARSPRHDIQVAAPYIIDVYQDLIGQ